MRRGLIVLCLAFMNFLIPSGQASLRAEISTDLGRGNRKSFCQEPGCKKRATFKSIHSLPNGHPAPSYYCAVHRPGGSVPSRSPAQLCHFQSYNNETGELQSCLRWPSYGSPDARKPEFCAGHAPAGSVNKKKKKCCVDGCRSTGTFGSLDDYRMYCVQHKDITHRDLRSRKCNEEGCDKQPSYQSFKGGKKVVFCSQHRAMHHLAIKGTRCRVANCSEKAVTSVSLVSVPRVELNSTVDSEELREEDEEDQMHTRCESSRQFFLLQGAPNKSPLALCQTHRDSFEEWKSTELDAQNGGVWNFDELCMYPGGCNQKAFYGDNENGVPIFCESHKASYHCDMRKWDGFQFPALVIQKRKRAALVRRLYSWILQMKGERETELEDFNGSPSLQDVSIFEELLSKNEFTKSPNETQPEEIKNWCLDPSNAIDNI